MRKPRKLDLVSMYLRQPVLGVRAISLQLEAPARGHMKGKATLDPNICTLDLWGDRQGCTRMAIRVQDVEASRMHTLDSHGHHRVHWAVDIKGVSTAKLSLIEYPGPDLWYLSVYTPREGTVIVPLFDAKLFAPPAEEAARRGAPAAGHA